MTKDELDQIAERRTYCEPFGESVSLSRVERDELVALARDGMRLGEVVDRLLAHCPDGECPTCGEAVCPHSSGLHFHHDGCPACAEHEAMAKEGA